MVGKNNDQIISAKIETEFESLEQIKVLFGSLDPGGILKLCDDSVELELVSVDDSMAFDGSSIVEFFLSFSDELATGVISSALYDVIRKSIKRLQINGRRTRTKEEDITHALEKLKKIASEKKKVKNKKLKKKKSKKKKKKE